MVCDGWSFGMIFMELCAIYNSLSADRIPLLPPAMSFADHARRLGGGQDQRRFPGCGRLLARAVQGWRSRAGTSHRSSATPGEILMLAAMESRKMSGERFAWLKKATPATRGHAFHDAAHRLCNLHPPTYRPGRCRHRYSLCGTDHDRLQRTRRSLSGIFSRCGSTRPPPRRSPRLRKPCNSMCSTPMIISR